MKKCSNCKINSISLICSWCKKGVCANIDCLKKHPTPQHHLHKPTIHLSRLLKIMQANFQELRESFNDIKDLEAKCVEISKNPHIDSKKANKISEDISNIKTYIKEVEKAERKLKEFEENIAFPDKVDDPISLLKSIEEVKVEIPLPNLNYSLEEAKKLLNTLLVPKSLNEDKQQLPLEEGESSYKSKNLTQAMLNMQVCLEDKVTNWIHRIKKGSNAIVSEYNEKTSEARLYMQKLRNDLDDLKAMREKEEAELIRKRNENGRIQKNIEEGNEELERVQRKLNEMKKKLKETKEAFDGLEKDRRLSLNDKSRIDEEIVVNKKELQEIKSNISKKDEKLKNLDERYTKKVIECSRVDDVVSNLNADIEKTTQKLKSSSIKLEDINSELWNADNKKET